MGSAYWSAPAHVESNHVCAVWSPTNDVGASVYNCFIGSIDGSYRAAFKLRLLESPGYSPNTLDLPTPRLDFATIEVSNAPWLTDESDPTVPAWAKSETQPLPPDYANVSNKAMTALQEHQDISGKLNKSGDTMTGDLMIENANFLWIYGNDIICPTVGPDGIGLRYRYNDNIRNMYFPGTSADSVALLSDIPSQFSYTAITNAPWLRAETDPTVPAWAMAASKPSYSWSEITSKPSFAAVATSGSYNDLSSKPTIPTVPTAQINAATTTNALQEAEIGETRQIVATWENFLDGSNVVFSITNYPSGSYNLDAAKQRILELRDGAYVEVYNSRDEILLHINDFSNRYVRVALDAIVDEVAARLASKADRDWGKYTSAGGEAPSNTVYMTAPNTVFAGGLEYERVAVGEGTICVLTTRGAPTWTQGDEGTFKFQDDGGTNYFGFAKTDSYTIGANTDGITVQGGMVTMNYNITMSGRPCVWYKSSLSSGAWEQLNLPDGSPVAGASHAVTWEANPDPGTQVCYINVGNAPSGFFRATVEVAGEAKFMTNMPADLSGGWICPNTATDVNGVIKPTFNGSSVIWTWSAK